MVGVLGDSWITHGTLESCKKGMGKVLATAGWGEGDRARDRNVLPADLQCVVVRFGGARKAPAPTAVGRMGSQALPATG